MTIEVLQMPPSPVAPALWGNNNSNSDSHSHRNNSLSASPNPAAANTSTESYPSEALAAMDWQGDMEDESTTSMQQQQQQERAGGSALSHKGQEVELQREHTSSQHLHEQQQQQAGGMVASSSAGSHNMSSENHSVAAGAAAAVNGASVKTSSSASSQHPKGRAATGGQTHSHRPVSAMPTPTSHYASASSASTAAQPITTTSSHPPSSSSTGASVAAQFANIVNNQPYNDRRASAHPALPGGQDARHQQPSQSQVQQQQQQATAVAASSGLDARTTNAMISSGIPITSPAAMQYFAAHPRRQQVHFGNYLLLQTLGEGEFGKVKLGVHKEWGEEVAVKLIKRDRVAAGSAHASPTKDAAAAADTSSSSAKDPSKMSKVEREIQVLKEVRHPNIVRLYEVIESDRYIGIVLEYASGGELFDHILAHKYLREKDACRLFAQLISGVHYLHQKSIIHRDLKLENLLLDRNRNVIITDFGFANNFGDKRNDLMATSCGSPCYAAPELVVQDGLYAGSAVDVWSCGVILYAMLAGYLPFDDDPANPDGDNINLLYKYIMATPLSFPEYITAEPRDLLSRMLVPDPLKRADLQTVMQHSWLAAYRDLFKFSVDDLERAAIEQQTRKRQAYRQQMLLQQQMRESQKQQQQQAQAQPATATGVPRSGSTQVEAGAKPRHQSLIPTSTTSPASLHDAASLVTGASLGAAASAAAPRSAPVHDPVVAQGEARGEPRSRTSFEDDSAAQPQQRQQKPPAPPPPSASASARVPAAQKTQRHTIQLEYAGEQQAQRAAVAAPMQPPPVRKDSSAASQPPAPASPDLATVAPPAQIPAASAVVPAAEQITQKAAAAPATRSQRSPSQPTIVLPPPLLAGETDAPPPPPASAKRRPVSATPQPVSVPFPDAGAEDRKNRVVSDNNRRGSKTSTASRVGPNPPVSASAAAAAEISEKKGSRHRNRLSRDNSFFSRLLSNAGTEGSPVVGQGAGMQRSPSDSGSVAGGKTRRKALSLLGGNRPNIPAEAKEQRRLTGKLTRKDSEDAANRRASTVSNEKRQSATPRPAQQQTPKPQQLNTPHQRDSSEFANAENGKGSTKAAKKVMDWFRKKSLAKDGFDEQPPIAFERPDKPVPSIQPAPAPRAEAPSTAAAPSRANQQQREVSGNSSRSTSGTHSYTSADTNVTAESASTSITTATGSSHSHMAANKSTTSTVQPSSQDTPRASATAVNGVGVGRKARKPFDDTILRHHVGAVDQSALTSLPPPEMLARVHEVLTNLGIDFRLASGEEYKIECLRPKKGSRGFTGFGSTIRTSVFPPSQAELERSGKLPSSPSMPSSGSIRNFLSRRSSVQPSPNPQQSPLPGGSFVGSQSQLLTQYGDATVDNGQEVRFSVEVTKIANLPGLYSLDVRRMKGNVWAYKWCYTALLQRCNLAGPAVLTA